MMRLQLHWLRELPARTGEKKLQAREPVSVDKKFSDPLLRVIVGSAALLGVLHIGLFFFRESEPVLAEIPMFVPMMHGFVVLEASTIAFLALGSHRALRNPVLYWIGIAFASISIFNIFYILSWPGLRADGQPIMGLLSGTAAWIIGIGQIFFSVLLIVGVSVRWPGEHALKGTKWAWSVAGWFVLVTLVNELLIAFEQNLPSMIGPAGTFTLLLLILAAVTAFLYATGAMTFSRYYIRSHDMLSGYVALDLTLLFYSLLGIVMTTKRYTLMWYTSRMLAIAGGMIVLFGLLLAYVRLYQKEQEKSRELETSITKRELAEAENRALNRELERKVQERSDALASVRTQNNLLQAVQRAQTRFISEGSPEKLFDDLLRDLLVVTNSEFGFIGEILFTEDGEPYLRDRAITDISWNEEARKIYQKFADEKGLDFYNVRGLWGTVILTGEPVISNDPANDPRSSAMPDGHPQLHSFLGVPFHMDGKVIGMAGLANRPGGYDKEFVNLLQPYVATCAAIIEAHRNDNRRREAVEQLAQTHAALELKVLDRTAELELANKKLVLEIQERRRAEQAITAERQRLYDVLETLPVYVCLLDSEYYMPFANRNFRETFGEPRGRRCHDFLFNRTEPCDICETYTVMKTRAPHHWYWTGPNGRDYDIYDFPFIDTDGSFLILEMGVDITERKQAEDSLKQTLADLTRSNADLEKFAYVASHDLQEPLRNVAGCLQLLEQKYGNQLDADADQYIGYAIEGAVRMKELVQDLLAYSRIGTRGKPPELVDCEEALGQTIRNLGSAISEAGAVITHGPLPTVLADDTQLLQVFQNLIQNAIKFRRDEPPHVHVSAVKYADEWIFSVQDNGIGIESRYFDRIFEIFQRLNKRERYDGTGMGLAIVKKVVDRHRGRVWVESEPGKGTTFYFTILEKGIPT